MKPPIEVAHLFPVVDKLLVELLESLSEEDWQRPTLAKQWTVKDVAAHLLDTNLRAIAGAEHYSGPPPPTIHSYGDLVAYLNQLNDVWVQAMKRVSPASLISMLQSTGRQYSAIMANAPLFTPAPFSVAWAGETESQNWFHIAREYTEKVHHQLQIREAVNKEAALLTRELFYPFIKTLLAGLPHALRNTAAQPRATVAITISSDAGGTWFAERKEDHWQLTEGFPGEAEARVYLEPGTAWKLFTKGISPEQAEKLAGLEGEETLCRAVLSLVAVMA